MDDRGLPVNQIICGNKMIVIAIIAALFPIVILIWWTKIIVEVAYGIDKVGPVRRVDGCWFCGSIGDHAELYYSAQWDCDFHLSCLKKRLRENPNCEQAQTIRVEFGNEWSEE